ncbi:MAG: CvpA family protein [Gammaproteobacteria bacterium]|nr:MAG: CvpA family protein [Gammaproteobacteria bacterium]
MVWIDIAIIALIVLSALLSLFRGFIKEALALASWLVALWVSMLFYEDLAVVMSQWIAEPSLQNIAAFSILFLSVLLLGGLINYLVSKLVVKTGLATTDRMLGVVFGVARGAFIVAIVVLFAGLTPLPQDSWWQESQLLGYFQEFALWMREYLPRDIAENISYV